MNKYAVYECCVACKQRLYVHEVTTGVDLDYCTNTDCSRYGLLTNVSEPGKPAPPYPEKYELDGDFRN